MILISSVATRNLGFRTEPLFFQIDVLLTSMPHHSCPTRVAGLRASVVISLARQNIRLGAPDLYGCVYLLWFHRKGCKREEKHCSDSTGRENDKLFGL